MSRCHRSVLLTTLSHHFSLELFSALIISHQNTSYSRTQWYDAIIIADIIVHLFCVVVDAEALWATEDGDANE